MASSCCNLCRAATRFACSDSTLASACALAASAEWSCPNALASTIGTVTWAECASATFVTRFAFAAELEHANANLVTKVAEAHSAQVTVPIVDASAFGQLHSAEAAKAQALARDRKSGV